jgi:hypothetical protein
MSHFVGTKLWVDSSLVYLSRAVGWTGPFYLVSWQANPAVCDLDIPKVPRPAAHHDITRTVVVRDLVGEAALERRTLMHPKNLYAGGTHFALQD